MDKLIPKIESFLQYLIQASAQLQEPKIKSITAFSRTDTFPLFNFCCAKIWKYQYKLFHHQNQILTNKATVITNLLHFFNHCKANSLPAEMDFDQFKAEILQQIKNDPITIKLQDRIARLELYRQTYANFPRFPKVPIEHVQEMMIDTAKTVIEGQDYCPSGYFDTFLLSYLVSNDRIAEVDQIVSKIIEDDSNSNNNLPKLHATNSKSSNSNNSSNSTSNSTESTTNSTNPVNNSSNPTSNSTESTTNSTDLANNSSNPTKNPIDSTTNSTDPITSNDISENKSEKASDSSIDTDKPPPTKKLRRLKTVKFNTKIIAQFIKDFSQSFHPENEAQFSVIKCSAIRLLFDRLYVYEPSVLTLQYDLELFDSKCASIRESTPQQLNIEKKFFVDSMLSQTFTFLSKNSINIQNIISDMILLQFYTNPIDIVAEIFHSLKQAESFIRENNLISLYGNDFSSIDTSKVVTASSQMTLDDFLSVFTPIFCISPPTNAMAISNFLNSLNYLTLAPQFSFAKVVFSSVVEYIQTFDHSHLLKKPAEEIAEEKV